MNRSTTRRHGPIFSTGMTALLLVVLFAGGKVTAQDLPPLPDVIDEDRSLPLQSQLVDAAGAAEVLAPAELRETLTRRGLILRPDGMVYVEIVGRPGGGPIPPALVNSAGGEFVRAWRELATAWMPADRLLNLARALPAGFFIQPVDPPQPDEVQGEGPAAIGSDKYIAAGASGSGVTIAIIDTGFDGLSEARTNGDAPVASVDINFTGSAMENPDDGSHGTGCLEAAFDHAPDATWHLYKIDSVVDLGAAVDTAIARGVDVISHSLSWYNRGWDDDSGPPCQAAHTAGEAGIVFFTSAGNRAETHYEDMFADADSDGWHDFAVDDETIDITMPDGSGSRFYLSWDSLGTTHDYDLYLYNADDDSVMASSTTRGTSYESFYWENDTGSALDVDLAVKKYAGSATTIEIFMHKSGTWTDTEFITAAGSTTSPSNSTHPLVISVGAVTHSDFDSNPGTTGILKDYSGRGPSNSGMTLPDLCGPTDTQGYTYSTFTGTSCATPNVAGAAGAFWSCETAMQGKHVAGLFRDMALLFRDWGTTGMDNLYGKGGAIAPMNHSTIVLLNRGLGNTAASDSLPFYYVSDAVSYASSGARMLFLGGTYPEAIDLDMQLDVDNYGSAAVVGGP